MLTLSMQWSTQLAISPKILPIRPPITKIGLNSPTWSASKDERACQKQNKRNCYGSVKKKKQAGVRKKKKEENTSRNNNINANTPGPLKRMRGGGARPNRFPETLVKHLESREGNQPLLLQSVSE